MRNLIREPKYRGVFISILAIFLIMLASSCSRQKDSAKKEYKSWWDSSSTVKSREHLQSKAAPGVWEVSHKTLISGQTTNLELRYIHGDEPMPPYSYHRISIEPFSVQSVFHCHPSEGYRLVPYKGVMPKVDLEKSPVTGLGTVVKLTFPEGLKPGDSFAVALGNDDGSGNIQAIVNPVPMEDIPTMVFSNMTGDAIEVGLKQSDYRSRRSKMWSALPGEVSWFDMGWTDKIAKATVIAGPASSLRVFGPSLIEAGDNFDLRIAVTDEFDSRCTPLYTGAVTISPAEDIKGLPSKLTYRDSDNCSKVIKGLSISQPGVYRIKAALDDNGKQFESNPIVVREKVEEPIYWGNIHNHNCYSECWGGTMDRFYSFARDISGMDFVSISDHRGSMPLKDQASGRLLKWKLGHEVSQLEGWKDCIVTAQKYNDPGRFIALVGYEWGTPKKLPDGRGFHMNVYHSDMTTENIEKYFMANRSPVEQMYDFLRNLDHVIFIPHKHGHGFPYELLETTVAKDGYPITPGIEVYSDWGDSFSPYGTWDVDSRFGGKRNSNPKEPSYQEAVDQGYKLSVISDSDSHTGLPGRRVVGGMTFRHDHSQGVTAVRANDFTRKGIIRGYQGRKTYGTTGEHIFLEVKANGVGVGQTLRTDKPFKFEVEVAGTDIIESVSLFDGMKLIEKRTPEKRDCKLVFDCPAPSEKERPYLVLVVQKDENRAWSTPIWVVKSD